MKLVINNESPISQLDIDSPLLEKRQPVSRFVLGSILLHVISAATVLMLKPTVPAETEVIEIEIAAGTPSTMITAPQQSEMIQEAAPTPPAASPKPIVMTAPVQTQVPQPQATVEDIEMPRLEEVVSAVDAEAAQLNNNEEIQNQLNEKLIAAQAAETQQLEQAQKLMQDDLDNAQALAAAEATAAQQKQAEVAAQGNATQSTAPTENVGELRSLSQLKQKPGNPRPSYDPKERLEGHNGAVIFKAFVTQDGNLKDFRMIQSSGYKNLDFKTLKALKQWKFYPGQEGWVELPFQWDLKGGPQEMPALLRRRVGQN